jgi:putative glutamine amidotransferase
MSTQKKALKIAVSACFFHADPQRAIFKGKTLQYVEQSIVHWLTRAGNHVMMLPALPDDSPVTLQEMAAHFDGLVLEGGSDVSPRTYGEEPLRPEWNGDAIRDRYEIALMNTFLDQKKPVLGVCRGAQLMNVAFGGTLYQDIETQVPNSLNHRNWEIYDQNFHELEIAKGSKLSELYGDKIQKVNTIHHQAIRKLGKGLHAEAISPKDGIIEAIRHNGDVYAMAVQWHPEFQDRHDPSLMNSQPFLEDFMQACRTRKDSTI